MTDDWRKERVADNEAMFRLANERTAKWDERRESEEASGYFCECGDASCHERVMIEERDYERVRANSRRFLIAVGHERPEVESVVESHDGWSVVEKRSEAAETAEATDPRRDD